jgi:hypothetical protein
MLPEIDPIVRDMAEAFVKTNKNGRAVLALKAMLNAGFVTTDDLNAMGYNHPPRAIADVRDHGIPVITESVKNSDGRRMARYRLGMQMRFGPDKLDEPISQRSFVTSCSPNMDHLIASPGRSTRRARSN